uniref:Uncharacterized protein n=1 Tax=Periophthalmus magnuspinnatus TaxID=409849 RepID=A0A3B4ASM5_9GOBI
MESIQRLKSQLRETEEQVQKAAQAGLDLLNQQMDLQNRLDEQRVEMTNVLEQEKYSLQKDVELKSRMLESLQFEFEGVKNQQRQQLQEQEELLERNHNVTLTELNNKVTKYMLKKLEVRLGEEQLKYWMQQHR